MKKSLSIVIPCLNEEQAIPSVLAKVAEVRQHLIDNLGFEKVQVIVVDDASQDQSHELLTQFDFIEIVKNSKTMGYGSSLKLGFQHSTSDWICFFDMDNTYPPEQIPSMLELLIQENLDIVVGRRLLSARGMSTTRGLGNWMYGQLTKRLLKTETRDVCSGFRVFRKELLPVILNIPVTNLAFSLEMSIRLSLLKFKSQELDISYHPRKGDSKLSVMKDGFLFLSLILKNTYKYKFQRESRFDRSSNHVQRTAKVFEPGAELR